MLKEKSYTFFDWLFLIVVLLLSLIGLLLYYSLSASDGVWQVLKQFFVILISFGLFFWLGKIDYRSLKSVSGWLYILGILFLILVLIFGRSEFGARRWLDLGIIGWQPSEVVKFFYILYMARFLSSRSELMWKDVGLSFVVTCIPMILIAAQPDMGTALVFLGMWICMIFVSPLKKTKLWSMALFFLLSIPLIWFGMKDYQKERIMVFLDPASDPFGSGYNVLQSQIAIGSGGLWGFGLGKGIQSQMKFLPVAYSDFAFAVLAEQFGFVGSAIILVLFGILIWQIWRIGYYALDQFGMYLAIGIGAMFIFQLFVNIAMNLGIMPVTGIPLPFISSGGTSLLVVMSLLGLVKSIRNKYSKN